MTQLKLPTDTRQKLTDREKWVYAYVRENPGKLTWEIQAYFNLLSFGKIANGDRYLRFLQEKGYIEGTPQKDKQCTWKAI